MHPFQNSPHIFLTIICLVTVVSAFFLTYSDVGTVSKASLILFHTSAGTWGYFSLKYLIINIRNLFFTKKLDYEIEERDDIIQMANKMRVKLNKHDPIVIREKLNNAYFNIWSNQLILGTTILKKLDRQERLALSAHELTHAKENHVISLFLMLLIIILFMWLSLNRADWILGICVIALFLALLPHIGRAFEYKADTGAAKKVGLDATISFLKKIVASKYWNHEYIVHPSVNRRIQRLSDTNKIIANRIDQ